MAAKKKVSDGPTKALYVASSFLNKNAARRAINRLKREGFHITSRWLAHRPTNSCDVLREEAVKDHEDVTSAECVVVIWPGRLGTAAEMGIAIGQGKPIHIVGMVVGERLNNVYVNHPSVQHHKNLTELIRVLLGETRV